MRLVSRIPELPVERVRSMLEGLPDAPGYEVIVKHLRYRTRAHLSAWTDFAARCITLQVPDPFLPFGEVVPYAARRLPGKGLRFAWLSEGVTFREPREVLRFLYCHEWMHWYLREKLGRKGAAETACERFALFNYRRRTVTFEDAERAIRRRPGTIEA
jgi:hypothetical protein